ncbi:MAG TPA: hypothetical protein VF060_11820 [Trebonia sp.]
MAGIRGRNPDDEDDEDDVLVSWLTSLSYDDLVAEIVDLADGDEGIRALLEARATAQIADELIEDGAADEAIELAREAFAAVTAALARPGGAPESLASAARELLGVHLRACRAADPPPGPVELGTYLADLILDDTRGLTPSLEDYADLLGRAGTLAIRDRITAVYRANPGHANARHLAGSLAGPVTDDAALRERRARHEAEPSLGSYRALRAAARQANTWNTERIKALSQLPPSVLIDALLDDGDLDAAWAVLAQPTNPDRPPLVSGDAAEEQRLRLADASLTARPAQALGVYLAAAGPLTRQTGDAAYRKLVRLLTSARACHQALGTTGEFGRYMAGLREANSRKRNLIRLLDDAGL